MRKQNQRVQLVSAGLFSSSSVNLSPSPLACHIVRIQTQEGLRELFCVPRRTGSFVQQLCGCRALFQHLRRWYKFGSEVSHGPFTLMGLIIS